MEKILIISLFIALNYFFILFKKILEIQTTIACKSLGLNIYDRWKLNFKCDLQYNPEGYVEHFEPMIKYNPKSKQCLLAIGYKTKYEVFQSGWEYQITWEIYDIVHEQTGKNDYIDKWFYGTSLPGSRLSDGNLKKTEECIKREERERERGNKILSKFYNSHYGTIL